jgi:hypothetical protein
VRWHGTTSMYNGGCRCVLCVEAHREYARVIYHRNRRTHGAFVRVHGHNGYVRGCRCQACKDGYSAYMKEYRRRRKANGGLPLGRSQE